MVQYRGQKFIIDDRLLKLPKVPRAACDFSRGVHCATLAYRTASHFCGLSVIGAILPDTGLIEIQLINC